MRYPHHTPSAGSTCGHVGSNVLLVSRHPAANQSYLPAPESPACDALGSSYPYPYPYRSFPIEYMQIVSGSTYSFVLASTDMYRRLLRNQCKIERDLLRAP